MAFLSSSSPISLILFISLIILPNSISASLEDSCKALNKHSPDINVDFCITSLQVDPSSQSADFDGLALIAINLASKNATSTNSKIEKILKDPSTTGKLKSALEDCQDLYSGMPSTLSDAAGYIRSHEPHAANINLSAAFDTSSTCEEGFQELGIASILTKEDGDFAQLCSIGLAITHSDPLIA